MRMRMHIILYVTITDHLNELNLGGKKRVSNNQQSLFFKYFGKRERSPRIHHQLFSYRKQM